MVKEVVMHNGVRMPIIGYGTWTAKDESLRRGLNVALETGYRHIDTAYLYDNEHIIGEELKKWFDLGKLKRSDVFITTKLPGFYHRAGDVEKSIKESLAKLQLDYVDLFLIHTPFPLKRGSNGSIEMVNDEIVPVDVDHLETWRAMEEVLKKGYTRSIGLSNFSIRQTQRIMDNCTIKPHNVQVECHIYFPQNELNEFCKKHDITFVAYGPIGSPGRKNYKLAALGVDFSKEPIPMEDEIVKSLAQKYKKTPAQVLLRWLIQRDIVVIPKSVNEERIKENFNIFDFQLSHEEMKSLRDIKTRQQLFIYHWARNHPMYPWKQPPKCM